MRFGQHSCTVSVRIAVISCNVLVTVRNILGVPSQLVTLTVEKYRIVNVTECGRITMTMSSFKNYFRLKGYIAKYFRKYLAYVGIFLILQSQ